MKRNVLGNGTSQCLLCGEEFGLLGASASECEECSKVERVWLYGTECDNKKLVLPEMPIVSRRKMSVV